MTPEEIIDKKRCGEANTQLEFQYMIEGLLNKSVKLYQISSWFMAICIQGLSFEEAYFLTDAMLKSGKSIDWKNYLPNDVILMDKHSTGGVGDKVTLILAPLIASFDIPIIKLSGKSLGYTGGTIDKLLSIPKINLSLSENEILQQIKNIGLYIGAQSNEFVPVDKILYELRHKSATVNNSGLIASSIISKKLAFNSDIYFFDIKVGKGAFINNEKDAKYLVEMMKYILRRYDKEAVFVLSKMDQPLGNSVGNILELKESIEFLKGEINSPRLRKLIVTFASQMLLKTPKYKNYEIKDIIKECEYRIQTGAALQKFNEFIIQQHGIISELEFLESEFTFDLYSNDNGYISQIDAEIIGKVVKELSTDSNEIDYLNGIVFYKEIGDHIFSGERIAQIHYGIKQASKIYEFVDRIQSAIKISDSIVEKEEIIIKVIK